MPFIKNRKTPPMSRTYSLATTALRAIGGLAVSIAFACFSVLLFIVEVLPAAASYAWRVVVTVGVAAYRQIGQLKPEYRDSYETHGLSLFNGRPA